jgi:hypothetical protein
MAVPVIDSVRPSAGPADGDELVQLLGRNFGDRVAVELGGRPARRVLRRTEGGVDLVDAWTPPHAPGSVDVILENLDANGQPLPGERAVVPRAYRYERAALLAESDLTRLVRVLLVTLKEQVLEHVHLSVAVDYDESPGDGLRVVALASLPSLVLSGPQLRPNLFFSDQTASVAVVDGASGPDLIVRRPTQAFDLSFQITGASSRSVELLNLLAATTRFLDRNRWVVLPRDPARPDRRTVRFELDGEGETRTRVAVSDGVHVFTLGLVIRGVPLVEGAVLDRTRAVEDPHLQARR